MAVDVLVRAVRGLEWITADEVTTALPTAERVSVAAREISVRLPALDPALLQLRTADDAFLSVGVVDGVGRTKDVPPVAAAGIAGLDWSTALARLGQVRSLPRRPRFDVVASLEGKHNYNRFTFENAVGTALAPVLDGRYLERTATGRASGEPTISVRVFVRAGAATVGLRLGERPLHRRGWKQSTGAGTLHPPVAAALCRLAAPPPGAVVADPFCGDGTIAIEAALARPDARILAGDIDAGRLGNTLDNAARAGVDLDLREQDAGRLAWPPGSVDAILTNPPWNVAVEAGGLLSRSLDRFWWQVPGLLAPAGVVCLVADVDLRAPDHLRQQGYHLTLAVQARLAGRVLHVILGAPRDRPEPSLAAGAARWRNRTNADGVTTDSGF